MAITRTIVKPVQGQSPIILHNVPQSITVGDITGDKGTNEVWEDTKKIEDFTATVTTLDEYSTGVPYKKITVTSELNTSTNTWGTDVEEIDEAEEKTFTIPYKGHERDFAIEIKDNKAYIRYRWGMNDSHNLSVEKDITITERPRPSEGGRGSNNFILVEKYYEDGELLDYKKIQKLSGHYLEDGEDYYQFNGYDDTYARVYTRDSIIDSYEDTDDLTAVRNYATEDVEYIEFSYYTDSYLEEQGISIEEWLNEVNQS